MVTVAILHMNSVIDGLMWIVFEQKCVKMNTFYFALTNASALTQANFPYKVKFVMQVCLAPA